MSDTRSRPDLPVLTSLRFFAAVIVVAYHLDAARLPMLPEIVRGWFASGYEAVTFFFLLSGFILVYAYSGPRDEDGLAVPPEAFLVSRITRIGPAYYLGLAMLLPLYFYKALVTRVEPWEAFVPALLLVPAMLQSWYPPGASSWNPPAWSLSVELFFYACFPLLMRQANRLSVGLFALVSAGLVLATELARAACDSSTVGTAFGGWFEFLKFHPVFHLSSFVFGMALGRAWLFGRAVVPGVHALCFMAGATAVLLLLGYRETLPAWALSNVLLVPVFGLVVYGGAGLRGFAARALSGRGLVLLGQASYSMYILHWAVIYWTHWVARKVFGTTLAGVADVLVTLPVVIALSVLSYLFFERPVRRAALARYLQQRPGLESGNAGTAAGPRE
jgi:peptidoglycan/LPS O-acetylase OafA/YrhL